MAGEIAGTEKLLRENPQITILRSEDALYLSWLVIVEIYVLPAHIETLRFTF